MKNWKDLFELHILGRGRDYYSLGAVHQVTEVEDGYEAHVAGSENYTVEIDLENNLIDEMWCSCPYAEGGNYCKHMAAVLYYISDEELIKSDSHESDVLQKVLDEMTEKELRDFLSVIATSDSGIKNRIISAFSNSISEKEITQFKNEVDDIAYRHSGKHGFIEYYQADSYINELNSTICSDLG